MSVKLIIIAAVSTDGVIGVDNEIPWRIPEDFQHFRKTTMGNMLLVGYNTFLTLPPKAFEGRSYLVLNSDNPISNAHTNVYQFKSLETIFGLLDNELTTVEKVYVAGGAMVYDTLIDYCDEAIITWVDKLLPYGNKRFPIDKLFTNFEEISDEGWQRSKTEIRYKIVRYKNNFKRISV
jgi:dihydrofolate reductase